jgi:hypothetical protein
MQPWSLKMPVDGCGVDRQVEVVGMELRKAARQSPLGGGPLMAGRDATSRRLYGMPV